MGRNRLNERTPGGKRTRLLPGVLVDLRGLEPLTPCMPCRCATSCATDPECCRKKLSDLPEQLVQTTTLRPPEKTERRSRQPNSSLRQLSVTPRPRGQAPRSGRPGSPSRDARGRS